MDEFITRLELLLRENRNEELIAHISNNTYSLSNDQINSLPRMDLYKFIADEVCSPEQMNKYPRLRSCHNLATERSLNLFANSMKPVYNYSYSYQFSGPKYIRKYF